jgi:transglutaminase-like putative cysteine protease
MMTGQRFGVSHRTTYDYSRPMNDGYTLAVVMPRETPWQTVEHVDVVVDPEPDERGERSDIFGNRVLQLGVHRQHERLTVSATSEVTVRPMTLDGAGPAWEDVAASVAELRGPAALDVRPFGGGVALLADDTDLADLGALAGPAFSPGRPIVEAARELCRTIHEQFDYDHAFTEVSTPLATVLAGRRGVCQDFAHLAIGALRMFGLPARYVSGYVETSPPDRADEGRAASVATAMADASHAWCSVWVPAIGWVDFDPTNGHLPAASHVTVAWGRDYGDVAPVRGVVIGPPATQQLTVAVDVTRL